MALVSCGGGQGEPAAPAGGGRAADAGVTGDPSIALNPPGTVGQSNRIGLSWQAPSTLTSFTVLVKRAADLGFEAVDATVGSNSAQFARGASWRLDFPTALVRVRGCDASNQCVDSNEQPLLDVLLAGVAQVNPAPGTPAFRAFGRSLAFSADGNTLAAIAPGDPLVCDGLGNSIQIFQRGADGHWTLEARIQPLAVALGGFFLGDLFGLSGDGQTLVAGVPTHTGTVGGINPPEGGPRPVDPRNPPATGAAYIFTRDAQQRQWSQQAFIKAAVPVNDDVFGLRAALSHDGNRALVGGRNRMYLFERTGDQWRQTRVFGDVDPFYLGMAISANGESIAVGVHGFDETESPVFPVLVYQPCSSCSEGWRQVADLRSARPTPSEGNFFLPGGIDGFGVSLSFSSDGKTLAVGAPQDPGDGATMNTAAVESGAVYIFAAGGSGVWQQVAFLKARTVLPYDRFGGVGPFGLGGGGDSVTLSGDGKVLAAKACGYAANAQGLRRNHRADATIGQPQRVPKYCGSAYIFEQSADGTWSHTAAVLPTPDDLAILPSVDFGNAGMLAMSADAQTLGWGLSMISGDSSLNRSRLRVY